MSRIFISYRREDTGMGVGRLADSLREHFAREQVFQDISSIDPGADFIDVLQKALADCAAVLVVIGPKWLTAADRQGRRRLDDPEDWVRQEIAEALGRRDLKVFPLLVDGANMPSPAELPDVLKPLARRQAHELTLRHWAKDVAVLIDTLKRIPALAAKPSSSGVSGPSAAAKSGPGGRPIPWKPVAAAVAMVAVIVVGVYSGSGKKPTIEPIAEQAPATPPAVTTAPPARAIRPPVEDGAKPLASFRDCDWCPEMVALPGGSFTMGSPADEKWRSDEEGPQHQVQIPYRFAVGKYEITFQEWDACVAAGACSHRPADYGWGKGMQPVVNVSWNDAREYAVWLTKKTGKSYRLLSEAEWEYAARAGTTTRYPWGDEPGANRANFAESGSKWSGKQPAPVGSFAANGFGLHDMIGNVWEWTQDCWNNNYEGAPAEGNAWESGNCGRRVVRGGSWVNGPEFARAAFRYRYQPDDRSSNLGFRLARTL